MDISYVLDKMNEDPNIYKTLFNFTEKLYDNLKNYNSLYLLGNGGSASDCDHITGELRAKYKNRNRKSFNVFSLSDSISTVTAISNDFSYEDLFYIQLKDIITTTDNVVMLTTSGTSKNIVKCFSLLQHTNNLLITGTSDNIEKIKKDYPYINIISIPIEYNKNNVPTIQSCTMILLHTMCDFLDFIGEK